MKPTNVTDTAVHKIDTAVHKIDTAMHKIDTAMHRTRVVERAEYSNIYQIRHICVIIVKG